MLVEAKFECKLESRHFMQESGQFKEYSIFKNFQAKVVESFRSDRAMFGPEILAWAEWVDLRTMVLDPN